MTIKDFIQGKTAYKLTEESKRGELSFAIHEYTVVSVGRKYVKVQRDGSFFSEEYYKINETDTFLEPKEYDYSRKTKLFISKEDAEDEIERMSLVKWFYKLHYSNAEKYTLEQLRAVKKILE